jgi:hypothetical protein
MIHKAGPLDSDGVQRCIRCGYILTDYRNSMVPEGTPPLRGFADGASVEVLGGYPKYSGVVEKAPTCGVMP